MPAIENSALSSPSSLLINATVAAAESIVPDQLFLPVLDILKIMLGLAWMIFWFVFWFVIVFLAGVLLFYGIWELFIWLARVYVRIQEAKDVPTAAETEAVMQEKVAAVKVVVKGMSRTKKILVAGYIPLPSEDVTKSLPA